jgi:hypothetical protein
VKKALLYFSLFVYLIGAINLTGKLHYCGGHLESFRLAGMQPSSCCGDTENEMSDCCKNIRIHAHINNHNLHQHPTFEFLSLEVFLPAEETLFFIQQQTPKNDTSLQFTLPERPPPQEKSPLYIKHRVLRI